MVIVVMGASGAGKSTVGALLAARRGMVFADADDFHPPENVAKMASGTPLDEADRAGWLAALAEGIDAWLAAGREVVLACSALRAAHRDVLFRDREHMRLVHLRVSRATLARRLGERQGHFMAPVLLDSQLATLEEPEDAIVVDADAPVEEVIAAIERAL
jgi:gluconokinase